MDQATLERVGQDVLPDIAAIRRDIHAEPELDVAAATAYLDQHA